MTSNECNICFEEGANFRTSCGHWFHYDADHDPRVIDLVNEDHPCLNQWLVDHGKSTCPICRRNLVVMDVDSHEVEVDGEEEELTEEDEEEIFEEEEETEDEEEELTEEEIFEEEEELTEDEEEEEEGPWNLSGGAKLKKSTETKLNELLVEADDYSIPWKKFLGFHLMYDNAYKVIVDNEGLYDNEGVFDDASTSSTPRNFT